MKELTEKVIKNVTLLRLRRHTKASEVYVDVIFRYNDGIMWEGSVPIHYRRTGIFANTPDEIANVINKAYDAMTPGREKKWLPEQNDFWSKSNKEVTQPFFDALIDGKWKCVVCQLPPNRNWARRVQDIKELGYTIATNTSMKCPNCEKNTTHLVLLRLPRGTQSGYETFSPTLIKRIFKVLKNTDAYENRVRTPHGLLPDHKFPEIRWDDNCIRENPHDMSDTDIKQKFQLLTNQRNQQKREVCRTCYQTGKRGTPFDINFFYDGGGEWPKDVPKIGIGAEQGCKGCGWYDLEEWRTSLNQLLLRLR